VNKLSNEVALLVFLGDALSELLVGDDDLLAVLALEAGGVDDHAGNEVGVNVGGGAAILVVSVLASGGVDGDTDGGTTVALSPGETVHGGSFVRSGETELVALSVDEDVLKMAFLEAGEMLVDDVVKTALSTGGIGGVVGVASRTVPVTSNGLGLEDDV